SSSSAPRCSLHHQDAANAARLFLPSYLTTEGTRAKPRLRKCGNLTGRYRFRFVRAAHHYPLLELLTRGCAIAYPTEVTHQLKHRLEACAVPAANRRMTPDRVTASATSGNTVAAPTRA